MAKVTKLDNGKYQVQVYDQYGKRLRPTFDKKGDADAFMTMVEKIKHDNKLVKVGLRKQRITFTQALGEFKQTKQQLRPKSIQKYNNVIRQFGLFVESLNITYLDEFNVDHATQFYNALISQKPDPTGNTDKIITPKPKTVNFYIATVKAFFVEEFIKQRIPRSPMLHIKNQRVEKKSPDFYTIDELDKFFKQEMPVAYRNAFIGLLNTGCRIEELAHLTWDNVDMKNKLIHIRARGEFKPKTEKSERTIPMNDILYDLIVQISSNKLSDIYPFCSIEGKILRERRLLDACKKYAGKAGITTKAKLHKFRSTFASHLVQSGVPLERVQELLGHSTITETQKHYAKLKTDMMHDDVNKITNLIKPPDPTK